jgi:hypothetical protein
MKKHLLNALTAALMLLLPAIAFAQVPTLGTAANFVIYSSNGAVKDQNVLSLLTGDVGTNVGSNTGFGNVNGVMHAQDAATLQCETDLIAANGQLSSAVVTISPDHSPSLGAPTPGETLVPGVYSIPAATTVTGILNLSGDANSVFIFKIGGSFSTAAGVEVNLVGGVTACNVFWQVNGLVSLATGTKMKGTIVTTNFPINMNGVTLEGRALALIGAITTDGVTALIPIGCGSPNPSPSLTGPAKPTLGSTECYVLFSSVGDLTNTNAAALFTGNVGTNFGTTVGFDPLKVDGNIHAIPDAWTEICKNDLLPVYDYLNGLPSDIELLYPATLGNNLVLTPHTYLMSSAATLTNNLYLDAQDNPDAVFVLQINGALVTAPGGAAVILARQAQAKNVYWKVTDGLVNIETNTIFIGTIIANAGEIVLKSGVTLDGRALTIGGAVTTAAASADMPPGCVTTAIDIINDVNNDTPVSIYPNPFSKSATIRINDASQINCFNVSIYDASGKEVMNRTISDESSTLETGNLSSGIYFYKVTGEKKTIKSGKLIIQK